MSAYQNTLTKNKTKSPKQKLRLGTWSLKCPFHTADPWPSGFETTMHFFFNFSITFCSPDRILLFSISMAVFIDSNSVSQFEYLGEVIVTWHSWFSCFYSHTSLSSSLPLVEARNTISKNAFNCIPTQYYICAHSRDKKAGFRYHFIERELNILIFL